MVRLLRALARLRPEQAHVVQQAVTEIARELAPAAAELPPRCRDLTFSLGAPA